MGAGKLAARIVIVEDHADIAQILKVLLEDAGYEVRVAADGLAGLDAIRQERPDLAVLDLGLPKLSGTDVLREVRHQSATRDLPVVVITAQPMLLPAVEALGISAAIRKPFDLEEVIRVVRRTLAPPEPADRDLRPLVLVVDDQPEIVRVIRHTLEAEGFAVVGTTDPNEGLALARSKRPGLVVTDLKMPSLGGIDLITVLKLDPATEAIPILVVTAAPESLARQDGRISRYGVTLLPKPFDLVDLTETVRRLVPAGLGSRSV